MTVQPSNRPAPRTRGRGTGGTRPHSAAGTPGRTHLGAPAPGTPALPTGATGGHPAPVKPSACHWPRCDDAAEYGPYCAPHTTQLYGEAEQ